VKGHSDLEVLREAGADAAIVGSAFVSCVERAVAGSGDFVGEVERFLGGLGRFG